MDTTAGESTKPLWPPCRRDRQVVRSTRPRRARASQRQTAPDPSGRGTPEQGDRRSDPAALSIGIAVRLGAHRGRPCGDGYAASTPILEADPPQLPRRRMVASHHGQDSVRPSPSPFPGTGTEGPRSIPPDRSPDEHRTCGEPGAWPTVGNVSCCLIVGVIRVPFGAPEEARRKRRAGRGGLYGLRIRPAISRVALRMDSMLPPGGVLGWP